MITRSFYSAGLDRSEIHYAWSTAAPSAAFFYGARILLFGFDGKSLAREKIAVN